MLRNGDLFDMGPMPAGTNEIRPIRTVRITQLGIPGQKVGLTLVRGSFPLENENTLGSNPPLFEMLYI